MLIQVDVPISRLCGTEGAAGRLTGSTLRRRLVLADPYGAPGDDGRALRIRFINTYRPVVPLFETIGSVGAQRHGWRTIVCLSRAMYRSSDADVGLSGTDLDQELIWIPKQLGRSNIGANLAFFFAAPFRLLDSTRADVNIFLTHPPLFYALGGAVSRARGVPYVVHLMDLYPEIFERAGLLSADSRAYVYLSQLALRALKGAAGIIVIGRCMQERLVERGIEPAKIHLVSNWTSPHIRPIDHRDNQFRNKFGLRGKFVVMYSGNMGLLHELRTLLAVAATLVDRPDIHFAFVGSGRQRALVQAAIDRGLPNVSIFDYQADGEDLAHSLSAADVHFVSLRAGCEGLVVPSKFYGAIAAGRPVIYEGTASGEVARVIEETGCGMVVRPGHRLGLRAAIVTLHADRRQLHALGAIALRLSRECYDPAVLAGAYCRAIFSSLGSQA